jgi:hypothetical protein
LEFSHKDASSIFQERMRRITKGVEKYLVDACFHFPLNAKSAFFFVTPNDVAYCKILT